MRIKLSYKGKAVGLLKANSFSGPILGWLGFTRKAFCALRRSSGDEIELA
jgi:hypothetical protein